MLRYLAMGALVAGAMLIVAPSQAGCCPSSSYTACRKPCSIKPCAAPVWCNRCKSSCAKSCYCVPKVTSCYRSSCSLWSTIFPRCR